MSKEDPYTVNPPHVHEPYDARKRREGKEIAWEEGKAGQAEIVSELVAVIDELVVEMAVDRLPTEPLMRRIWAVKAKAKGE